MMIRMSPSAWQLGTARGAMALGPNLTSVTGAVGGCATAAGCLVGLTGTSIAVTAAVDVPHQDRPGPGRLLWTILVPPIVQAVFQFRWSAHAVSSHRSACFCSFRYSSGRLKYGCLLIGSFLAGGGQVLTPLPSHLGGDTGRISSRRWSSVCSPLRGCFLLFSAVSSLVRSTLSLG